MLFLDVAWFGFKCGRGGIGRRPGFRYQCRKACGFESRCPHHLFLMLAWQCDSSLPGLPESVDHQAPPQRKLKLLRLAT